MSGSTEPDEVSSHLVLLGLKPLCSLTPTSIVRDGIMWYLAGNEGLGNAGFPVKIGTFEIRMG